MKLPPKSLKWASTIEDEEYIYRGEVRGFVPRRMHGYGTLTWHAGPNKGRIYIGMFKDNMFHGQGVYRDSSAQLYVGEYRNNYPNGQGTLTTIHPDGEERYVGEFKDGKYDGVGTTTFPLGEKIVGKWKNSYPWDAIHFFASGNIKSTYSSGVECEGCKPTLTKLVGTGTGFVVNKDYVVTADHVLEDCFGVSVRHSHKEIPAEVTARDQSKDLGLIRVGTPFPLCLDSS